MAFSSVDKFLSVAKILTDARLQELVEENRKLKLTLFWKTYGVAQLRDKISSNFQSCIQCECRSCNWSGKSREFNGEWECIVTRTFEKFLDKRGLSLANTIDDPEVFPVFDDELEEDEQEEGFGFHRGNVHVVLASSVTDWVVAGYGEKFSLAKSIDDPALVELKQLFQAIEELRPSEIKKLYNPYQTPPADGEAGTGASPAGGEGGQGGAGGAGGPA